MISHAKLFAADLTLGAKATTLGGGQLEVASVAPAVVLKAVASGAQAKAREMSYSAYLIEPRLASPADLRRPLRWRPPHQTPPTPPRIVTSLPPSHPPRAGHQGGCEGRLRRGARHRRRAAAVRQAGARASEEGELLSRERASDAAARSF